MAMSKKAVGIGMGVLVLLASPIVVILLVASLVGSILPDIGGNAPTCLPGFAQDAKNIALGKGPDADAYFNQFAPADKAERQKNALLIVTIGHQRKLTPRTIAIAVGTAIQESGLLNVNYGHLDSLGLFQQRWTQGWGTPEQIMDPVYSINKFYKELEKIPDRDSRPMVDVAAEVQKPNLFAYYQGWKWDKVATDIVGRAAKGADKLSAPQTEAVCEPPAGGVNKANDAYKKSSGVWQNPLAAGSYTITSGYGWRNNPLVPGGRDLHNGVDLAAARGTPIHAIADGTVMLIEWQPTGGNVTFIKHGDGTISGYAHQDSRVEGLAVGQTVKAGQVIGFVGSTGGSTGNHLHLMIFTRFTDDGSVEPVAFMREHGVVL